MNAKKDIPSMIAEIKNLGYKLISPNEYYDTTTKRKYIVKDSKGVIIFSDIKLTIKDLSKVIKFIS